MTIVRRPSPSGELLSPCFQAEPATAGRRA